LNHNHTDILILGAGIAGLSAGFQALNRGYDVRILESSNRVGGVIRSEWKDGYLLEYGPNTLQPNEELMNLISSLNLQDEVVLADAKTPRYIQKKGKLHPIPLSLSSFLTSSLLSLFGKIRILAEPLIPKKNGHEDENLNQFSRRRVGREATESLLKPFISGVWAGDANQLSAISTFPKLVSWEKTSGSIFRGALTARKNNKNENKSKNLPKGLLSFRRGLEALPFALQSHLSKNIELGKTVTNITLDKKWRVQTNLID